MPYWDLRAKIKFILTLLTSKEILSWEFDGKGDHVINKPY